MDDSRKKRFYWGLLLTWLPWIPIGVGLAHSFRGTSEQSATGLGVIAADLAENGILEGALLAEMLAVFLLLRSFSRGHWLRNSFSVVSLCASLLTISLFGFLGWLFLGAWRYRS